jgi:RHS repeat-associated protein
VLVAQPTSFVIWGGNTPGLRLGDRIQFWGAQWSRQVQGGDYAAQADFKGWSIAPLPPHLCQPNAHTTGTPRLGASCWTSKPGNSNPPVKLGSYVQVIVATSIAKNGSTIYGNIAATVVLQVDTSSAYGPDPGHPGYGTVIGVLEDGAGAFASSAASLISVQAATATRRISLYSPEMSLMAETELTTTARPAIPYEYIWFDGQPLAQVDGVGVVSWTFTDYLGTPLLQTSAFQGIVWRAEHEPYGSIYALRSYDRHQPLRFPGQEAEQLGTGANGVTERSYNVHRWYRAGWGRYTQADPLGRSGDPNPFAYTQNQPTRLIDALGLKFGDRCTNIRIKRKYAAIGLEGKWGHWWVEINGDESYGWWPKNQIMAIQGLCGVEGELNGQTSFDGSPTVDPYHGLPADEEFTPEIAVQEGCSCQDCAGAVKCMREFAASQRGGFSAFGLNCRSFQRAMMEHCCLQKPQELPPLPTMAVMPIF